MQSQGCFLIALVLSALAAQQLDLGAKWCCSEAQGNMQVVTKQQSHGSIGPHLIGLSYCRLKSRSKAIFLSL